ncbi:hypothetical protein ACFX11_037320 [Malus domestica]
MMAQIQTLQIQAPPPPPHLAWVSPLRPQVLPHPQLPPRLRLCRTRQVDLFLDLFIFFVDQRSDDSTLLSSASSFYNLGGGLGSRSMTPSHGRSDSMQYGSGVTMLTRR